MKQYKYEINRKAICKYSIDRTNFTSYLNFSDMYKHIEKILLASKVAVILPQPVWMNKSGQVVEDEMDSYGFKVPIEITRPDM